MSNNVYHVIERLKQKTGVWRRTFTVRSKKQNIVQDRNLIEKNVILEGI